jgi:hypothetical protein
MKSLVAYITEALKNDVQKWIKKIFDYEISLVKGNKIEPINVDVNNLNKPTHPFMLTDFYNDPNIKKLIANRNIGFVVTNQMLRNPKQYILPNQNQEQQDNQNKQMQECYPYWYQDGKNIYFIGLIIYDKVFGNIENYLNLISLESSLLVDESDKLNKAMLTDFTGVAKKLGNYIGISAKPLHPKMKSILMKAGFSISKENKEILIYKI